MKRRYLNYFVLFLSLFICSCKRKQVQVNGGFEKQEVTFDYFKSKAKVTVTSPDEEVAATMILRMQYSKIIWMSLSKFGKEAARAKLTPDSVYFIQKFPIEDRFYTIQSTQEYLQKTGLVVGFDAFQELLFGNHPVAIEKQDEAKIIDSTLNLVQIRNKIQIKSAININSSKLIRNTIILENKTDTLDIQYGVYQQIGNHYLPTVYTLGVSKMMDGTRQKIKTVVELVTPEFVSEELGVGFTIPEDYEKR